MSKRFFSAALGVAVFASAGWAQPAPGGSRIQAWLGRTVRPKSTEKVSFYVWNATAFEVREYRVPDADLEKSLADSSVVIDAKVLTPTRTFKLAGQQGEVPVAQDAGVYVYVAKATAGSLQNNESAQAVVVSRLGLAVKRDDASSLAFAFASNGASVVANVTVKVLDLAQGGAVASGFTNGSGLATFATPAKGALLYVARSGADVAIQQAWDRSYGTPPSPFLAHVQTDRPLYRPGQTVHYRAIVRETLVASSSYRTPVNQEVRVFLRDAKGNRSSIGTQRTGAFGTIEGSTRLGPAAPLGEYALEVETGVATPGTQLWPVGTASFGVQEYRKPEYKVEVVPDRATYVQGATLSARVKADYYFGAPVPKAKVHWTITKQPRWRWWNPWIEPAIMRCWMPPLWRPAAIVAQGDAVTAADGSVALSYLLPKENEDADYVVDAQVTDAANRPVGGSATVTVTRAAFDLVLSSDRYVYQPGDLIRLKANLASLDGKPVPGQSVKLDVYAVDAKNKRTLRVTRTISSDQGGSSGLVLLAKTLGQYVVVAQAKDAAGNAVSAERAIWIHDQKGGLDWGWSSVEIVADKDVYAPGDVALLLVKAPVKKGTGVLTLEAGSIKRKQSFPIFFGLGLVAVPVTAEMTPNVFAEVMVPTASGLVTAEKDLSVPAVDDVVEVTVTANAAEYRPGDKATFLVEARDRKGKPVRAEVALGIVDEALFALREDQTPRLADTFYPKVWNNVTTVAPFAGGGGPILWAAKPMAKTANAATQSSGGGKVREYFPDTLRWFGKVVTDAQGRATLTQVMADSLTTWRLTTRAVTADTMVGETTTTCLVRKDLVLRLATPRTLVEGDEMELSAIVHNLAREGASEASVQVKLDVTGTTLLDPPAKTVKVKRGDLATVTWRIRADEAGRASFTAQASASFDQDALRLGLPVAARGVAARAFEAGSLLKDGKTTFTLAKDPRAIDRGTELRVSLTPSLAGCMLDSLDYLTGYPYGCVEQTMSRFLPDLVVADVLRKLGKQDSQLAQQLPDMVRDGVERLVSMQGADGGFGWWSGNASDPFMSAYATYGLALAKRGGFEVPQDALDRAVKFLQDQVLKLDGDGRAYVLYALATANQAKAGDLLDLAKKKATLNPYAKAVLALSLAQANQTAAARDVLADLASQAIRTSGRARWDGKTIHYGAWQSNAVETTAYALRALLALDPQSALVPDAVAWLVERRQDTGQYVTTKDTAAVVYAMADYVLVTKELTPDLTVELNVNGKSFPAKFTAADASKRAVVTTIPGSALKVGANVVTISRQGTGALYYTALLDQKVRMDPIPAAESGISVRREFFKVTKSVDANGAIVEDVKPFVGTAKLGDLLRVKITMDVTRPADVQHVNLEDRFPTGFSVVDEQPRGWLGWSWWWSAREVHDDRVVFFATSLSVHGTTQYEYTYDLRAEVPGRFTALPAMAEAVYSPETHGRSDAKAITIVK